MGSPAEHSDLIERLEVKTSVKEEEVDKCLDVGVIPNEAFNEHGILRRPLNAFRLWLAATNRSERLAMAYKAGYTDGHPLSLQSRVFKHVLDDATRDMYERKAELDTILYNERAEWLKTAGLADRLRPIRQYLNSCAAPGRLPDNVDAEEPVVPQSSVPAQNTPTKKFVTKRRVAPKDESPPLSKRTASSAVLTAPTQPAKRIKIKNRRAEGRVCVEAGASTTRPVGDYSKDVDTSRSGACANLDARRLSSLSMAGVFVNRTSWSPESPSSRDPSAGQLRSKTETAGQIPWAPVMRTASQWTSATLAYPTRDAPRASSEPSSCLVVQDLFPDKCPEPCPYVVPSQRPNTEAALQGLMDRYQRSRQEFSEQANAAGKLTSTTPLVTRSPRSAVVQESSQATVSSTNPIVDDWTNPVMADYQTEDFQLFSYSSTDEQEQAYPSNDLSIDAELYCPASAAKAEEAAQQLFTCMGEPLISMGSAEAANAFAVTDWAFL